MARDPGSLWSPLAENGRQGSYTKTQFIVHSTGDRGSAAAIFNYFNRAEVVVESTFVVGRGPEDPTRQLLDSASGADANLGANQRAICVEVVGAEGDDYTDWQVSEIIRLGRWARATHPIESRICPTYNTSGYGWHVMFGSPGPWTPVAKSCPGPVRIQRLKTIVFPAIFSGTTPTAPPPEEDEDMKFPYIAFRSDPAEGGSGAIALAAPGEWVTVPGVGYLASYRGHGLVGPGEVNVPPNWFEHYKLLFTASQHGAVDTGALAAELAALVPAKDADAIADAVLAKAAAKLGA